MPTKRLRRARYARKDIDPMLWAMLTDTPPPEGANPFVKLVHGTSDAIMRPLWDTHRAAILAEWVKIHPGTRPALWWRYDAPRASPATQGRFAGTRIGAEMIEPRQLLRGKGAPLHEVTAYAPSYHYGIPAWQGDPDAPLRFETQHAYLKRHGLLRPGEGRTRAEPEPGPARIDSSRH